MNKNASRFQQHLARRSTPAAAIDLPNQAVYREIHGPAEMPFGLLRIKGSITEQSCKAESIYACARSASIEGNQKMKAARLNRINRIIIDIRRKGLEYLSDPALCEIRKGMDFLNAQFGAEVSDILANLKKLVYDAEALPQRYRA